MGIEECTSPEATEFVQRIHTHMIQTRGAKYRKWLDNVASARDFARTYGKSTLLSPTPVFFVDAGKRIEIIDTLYAALRMVDDYVDGDAALPSGWDSSASYVNHLIETIACGSRSHDPIARLLQYVLRLGQEMEMLLSEGVMDILRSMLFDAARRNPGKPLILGESELQHHFHLLDIRGTIGLWLIILRESRSAFAALSNLGEAVRISYNLRDLLEDTIAGYCNIPREDFERFSIAVPGNDVASIRNWCSSEPVREWQRKEVSRGMRLTAAYMRERDGLTLHQFTRGILVHLFEIPAQDDFDLVLRAA